MAVKTFTQVEWANPDFNFKKARYDCTKDTSFDDITNALKDDRIIFYDNHPMVAIDTDNKLAVFTYVEDSTAYNIYLTDKEWTTVQRNLALRGHTHPQYATEAELEDYQPKLTAGEHITINADNVIDADLSSKQNVLTAGNHITIEDDVISAEGGVEYYENIDEQFLHDLPTGVTVVATDYLGVECQESETFETWGVCLISKGQIEGGPISYYIEGYGHANWGSVLEVSEEGQPTVWVLGDSGFNETYSQQSHDDWVNNFMIGEVGSRITNKLAAGVQICKFGSTPLYAPEGRVYSAGTGISISSDNVISVSFTNAYEEAF